MVAEHAVLACDASGKNKANKGTANQRAENREGWRPMAVLESLRCSLAPH